jgi:hypothetical protein
MNSDSLKSYLMHSNAPGVSCAATFAASNLLVIPRRLHTFVRQRHRWPTPRAIEESAERVQADSPRSLLASTLKAHLSRGVMPAQRELQTAPELPADILATLQRPAGLQEAHTRSRET